MRQRVVNLEAATSALKPYLEQYLQEHGINTSKNFVCLNPKHKDTDASMSCKKVHENAYCYGCLCTMDIFQAAGWIEGKPTKGPEFIDDNVLYLANKYGVEVKLNDLTPEEIYEYRTYAAYRYASELISDRTFGDYTLADEEINRRKWDKDKVAQWGIGTVNYDEFKQRMNTAGYDAKFLAGVDLDRQSLFSSNSLLFTVYDDYGRPVGFSARNLKHKKDNKDSGPKYINTKGTDLECAIFKKGERLYGLEIAREASSPLYIFEGQSDVITARHYGLMNCCCTLGTALTDYHINLLKKHGLFNIVLVFDGDAAGQQAIQKALDEKFSIEKEFRVRLCQLPNGEDPDELLRSRGMDEFVRLKKWAAFEWRLAKFMEDKDGELPEDKRQEIAEKMARIIVSEPSHIRQEEMSRQVAKITGYELATISSEVKRLRNERDAETALKKRAAVESLLFDIQRNPDEIEHALITAQHLVADINKEAQVIDGKTGMLSFVLAQKEADEAKTGEFSGFFMKPEGLGGLAARLDDDWRSGTLVFVGGSEQSGKCQHSQTLVPLPSGEYKTIENIVKDKNSHILGMNDKNKIVPMPVSRWIDSGKLECFELKTKRGISTKPSETHPYYTLHGWKQAKDLKAGDKIAIVRKYDCFNNLHSPISEEDAILLGGLLSEGNIINTFGFCNTDQELIELFIKSAETKWGNTLGYRKENCTTYISDKTQFGSRLLDWLRSYNLLGCDAHTKFIPDVIFQCSPKRIGKFLGMFWAGDGWVYFNPDKNAHEVGLTLCNYRMIKQIRSLLLRFGINAKISFNKKLNQSKKAFDAWTISIRDIENIKKFYNNITIPLKYKQDNLKAILDSNKISIGSHNDNFPAELWDRIKTMTVAKGWTFNYLMALIGEDKNVFAYDKSKDRFKEAPAWYPKAKVRGKHGMQWLQITSRKLRLIGHLLQDQFLIDLADGDIYFDEIVSIKSIGTCQCYDLEVPTDHNFIAEDTVVHNSTLVAQMAYEIADDDRNDAICIYHSIDDAARFILYKWICNASQNLDMRLNYIANPNYWNAQGISWIKEAREQAYKKIISMVQEEKLILKDASNGQSFAYISEVLRGIRDKYPSKKVVLVCDNLHKYPDYGEIQGQERVKRLSNAFKNATTQYNATIISTVEYRKQNPGELPTNVALAESRALQYDASVILHLYNDLHNSTEEDAVLIHKDQCGNTLPRIWCKFGKNKVSGYEGREFVDLFGASGQYRAVDLDTAIAEQKERLQFIKENHSNKY